MFKAIGFVVVLIAIRLLMPSVFSAFEHALVSFFDLTSHIFAFSPNAINGPLVSPFSGQMSAVGSVNYIPKPAPLPPALMRGY